MGPWAVTVQGMGGGGQAAGAARRKAWHSACVCVSFCLGFYFPSSPSPSPRVSPRLPASPHVSPCLPVSPSLSLPTSPPPLWGPVSLHFLPEALAVSLSLHLCVSLSPCLPLDCLSVPISSQSLCATPLPSPQEGASLTPGMPLMLTPSLSCLSVCVCVSWAGLQRPSCGYMLCTVLLALAVLLAVAVTGAVLFLNHTHTPGTAPPPVVSTGAAGANSALVTVERADSSRLSILIDPRCPDLADSFARLESAQASVLEALTEHQAQPRLVGDQELLDTLADQLPRLLTRASELQTECMGLRKGHGTLGQGLSALQSEQGRLIQVGLGSASWGLARGKGLALQRARCLMSTASLNPQVPQTRGYCCSHLQTSP